MKHLIIFAIASSIMFFGCDSTQLKTNSRSAAGYSKCTSDSNCSIGQVCNLTTGMCIANSNSDDNDDIGDGSACTSSWECGTDQFCEMREGLTETHTCLAKKANGQSCHYPDNQGDDCIASTPSNKVCDPSDNICGIGYQNPPVYYCEGQDQCRDSSLYCDVDTENDVSSKCYGKKAGGYNYVCQHGYQCASGVCEHQHWYSTNYKCQ